VIELSVRRLYCENSACPRVAFVEQAEGLTERYQTLISHARTEAARFLGYDIAVHHNDRKVTGGRRSVNGVIRLHVPRSVVSAKQAQYMQRGKPARRPELLNQDDRVILSTYGSEYRGIVQYYLLAGDVFRLARLQWVMETSMLMTLANKHRSSVSKMARKYAATVDAVRAAKVLRGPHRRHRQEAAGRTVRRDSAATGQEDGHHRSSAGSGQHQTQGTGHPAPGRAVRVMRARRRGGSSPRRQARGPRKTGTRPPWADLMSARHRKTLVVCGSCHTGIHGKKLVPAFTE